MSVAINVLSAVATRAPYECVTEKRMAQLTGLNPAAIADACTALLARKLLRCGDKGCHQLTSAGRALAQQLVHDARKQGKSRLHGDVWYVLRQGKTVTIPDLVLLVARGGEKRIEKRICEYLNVLARGGYARQMPVRDRSLVTRANAHGHTRWRILNDTGELAPVWGGVGTIYDPNTKATARLAKSIARAPRKWRT